MTKPHRLEGRRNGKVRMIKRQLRNGNEFLRRGQAREFDFLKFYDPNLLL